MKCIWWIILLTVLIWIQPSLAQEVLTKEAAVEKLLGQNFGIRIARNNLDIAANNTSIYNSGYLPTVFAQAGGNLDVGNSRTEFHDSSISEANGSITHGQNALISVDYTIYDSKGRAYNYEKLKALHSLSELEVRQVIESTLANLLRTYYGIAKLTEDLEVSRRAMEVSNSRMLRAQYRYEYGQGLKIDILNAEVDFNRDSVNYLRLAQQLDNAKRDLNVVLAEPANAEFTVDTQVRYTPDLSLVGLLASARTNNVELQQARKNITLSEYDLKIAGTVQRPKLGANASYSWIRNDYDELGISDLQTNHGLNAGLTLSWNIFDGGFTRTRMQNAKIGLQNQEMNREQLVQTVERDIYNAWKDYENLLYVLAVERHNLQTNKVNFERTQELFNNGRLSSVEFRQAQINLIQAQTEVNGAKYDAKLAELQLLLLSGQLMGAEY